MDDPAPLSFALDSGRHVSGALYGALARPALAAFVLAHGAGAPQSHPFIVGVARGLVSRGISVVTFNFPYMEARGRVPDPPADLEACYAAVTRQARAVPGLAGLPLVIGGKSMGGRIASQVAARHFETAAAAAALVFLGYPLHPPRKGDGRPSAPGARLPSTLPRAAHLPNVRKPMLFVQGSRDAFGTPAELEPIIRTLTPVPELLVVDGGDHSFSMPKAMRRDPRDVLEHIVDGVARWIVRTLHGADCTLNIER